MSKISIDNLLTRQINGNYWSKTSENCYGDLWYNILRNYSVIFFENFHNGRYE